MHSLSISFFFFFLGGGVLDFLFFSAAPPSHKNYSGFSPSLRNSTDSCYKQTEILERGECEFDKNPGGRFFSNKDHVGERE